MKKLLALVLIVALATPVIALADDADVVGCWAHYEKLTTGAPSMSMIYLSEDHVCYYLVQMFNKDEAGLGRTYVGTWEMQSDGTVLAKIGNKAKARLKFSNGFNAALDMETGSYYLSLKILD